MFTLSQIHRFETCREVSHTKESALVSNPSQGGRCIFGALHLFARVLIVLLAVFCLVSGPETAKAEDGVKDCKFGCCTATANAALNACGHEIQDDFWTAIGKCKNLSDPDARAEGKDEAAVALQEGKADCAKQFVARLEICEALGEAPYDPQIDPAQFVDPSEIGKSVAQSQQWKRCCVLFPHALLLPLPELTLEVTVHRTTRLCGGRPLSVVAGAEGLGLNRK
jgi:hypothetical protein